VASAVLISTFVFVRIFRGFEKVGVATAAPLNGELLRQRRLAIWLRQPASGACSAKLAVSRT
jgi:hypothetical protein